MLAPQSHEKLLTVIDLPQPTGADLWPPEDDRPAARLHKPLRALVGVAELILAALAVWGAFACWKAGVVPVLISYGETTTLESQRYFGGPLAGAIGLGVLAAILVVDAIRQFLLAMKTRHRAPKDSKVS
ncbi:hypothetical protein [Amycolatopsis regifaucium]|uniref:Uncharacterized protein n=1 Tax=Amycolatopsis regifaucium TaxID=546365 RepID=A0A154ME61_9PSEU|nr:hypothetical protein [Amycolatopsis regifaucium]KZB81899.1 hypothetical protein AVL48_08020 [Amycolatopsis regifaucium]OKA06030.1 hypothetical protein ATP06_0222975 [Amycolatopsis regifaucium]SFG75956.1 hypothetical protein SAMN04489731_101380 [Amycolatopsis regifaucium]